MTERETYTGSSRKLSQGRNEEVFKKNRNILLPTLCNLGQSFFEQTIKNPMDILNILMQIMFLYNKDNDRVTILKQLNAQG